MSSIREQVPAIELVRVGRTYASRSGQVSALSDFNLTVQEGEIVTVVGPSGCGKSTLLNLLARLEAPDHGELRYRGQPSGRAEVKIGYVTQSDTLFPWRTLAANVEYPLEIRGVGLDERRAKASAMLARVGLSGFEDYLPYQLSGGMRQRGNIVRALVYGPDIVLMDEPFGALDAQTRILLQGQLQTLCAEECKTVVFITHDLQEAISLGDKIAVMTARPGRVKLLREVGMERPRDLDRIHENSRFQELLSECWDSLREEVVRASPASSKDVAA